MRRHWTSRLLTSVSWVILVAVAGVIPSIACDVFPIHPGASWTYVWTHGGSGFFSMVVIDTTTVNGYEVLDFQTEYDYDPDGISHNYYSLDEDDHVLMHGWVNDITYYSELLYSPPMIIIECPLEVGNSWQVNTTYYDNLEGLGEGQPLTLHYEVVEYSQINTPAGDFLAYLVVQSTAPGEGEIWIWYAPGLGKIKYSYIRNSTVFGSYSLSAHEVPVESTAWGGLKATFR